MNPEIILTAMVIVNDEIKRQLTSEYDVPSDIMSALPGCPKTFEVGHVAIIRTVILDDLFQPQFGNRMQSIWIATREQFDAKFVFIDDAHRTENFGKIRPKQ